MDEKRVEDIENRLELLLKEMTKYNKAVNYAIENAKKIEGDNKRIREIQISLEKRGNEFLDLAKELEKKGFNSEGAVGAGIDINQFSELFNEQLHSDPVAKLFETYIINILEKQGLDLKAEKPKKTKKKKSKFWKIVLAFIFIILAVGGGLIYMQNMSLQQEIRLELHQGDILINIKNGKKVRINNQVAVMAKKIITANNKVFYEFTIQNNVYRVPEENAHIGKGNK